MYFRYRLAPEHTYPTALADCLSVLRYVMRHAGDLGIDSSRVALMGNVCLYYTVCAHLPKSVFVCF